MNKHNLHTNVKVPYTIDLKNVVTETDNTIVVKNKRKPVAQKIKELFKKPKN